MICPSQNTYPAKIHTLPLRARDLISTGVNQITSTNKKPSRPFASFYRTPNLMNTKINFEGSNVEQSIKKTLDRIKVSKDSNLNLQVKAGHNTIFNLQPALIFAEHTRNSYPHIPITVSIRLDDNKGDLAPLDQNQLQQRFKEELIEKLLKKSFPGKTANEISSIKTGLVDALNQAQAKNIQLKFIPQQASNSTYESYLALKNDYANQMQSSHFIEFTQNAPLQNRSNIGISTALKELQKRGHRTYPNISIINTSNFKSWCPFKDSMLEQASELYDTALNLTTGSIRNPNSPSGFLSKLKYKLSEGKTQQNI